MKLGLQLEHEGDAGRQVVAVHQQNRVGAIAAQLNRQVGGQRAGAATGFAGHYAVDCAGGVPRGFETRARQPLEDAAHGIGRGVGNKLTGAAAQTAQDEVGIVARVQRHHRHRRGQFGDEQLRLLGIGGRVQEADVAGVAFHQRGDGAGARVLDQRAGLLHGEFREDGMEAPLEIRLRAHHQRLPYDGPGAVG